MWSFRIFSVVALFQPIFLFNCDTSLAFSAANVGFCSLRSLHGHHRVCPPSPSVRRGLFGVGDGHRVTRTLLLETAQSDAPAQKRKEKDFLLDRLGGEAALTAAVDELYERLVVDGKLMRYFEGVDVEKIKEHQFNFMRLAFTEIPEDADIAGTLTTGHDRLWKMGLDETDFDVVAGHLVGTLQSLEVEQDLIDEAIGIVAPLRGIFENQGAEE